MGTLKLTIYRAICVVRFSGTPCSGPYVYEIFYSVAIDFA